MKENKATQPNVSTKPSQPIKLNEPNLIMRDKVQIRMDLFKLELANMRKNMSWQPKQPRIEEVEHVHFYRTSDENGKPMQYSTPVGGHFHKMEWSVNENGDFIVKCGPALKHEYKKLANGTSKKVIVPVQYQAQRESDEGVSDYLIKDDHTHECQYKGSEFMTAEIKREIQKNNAAQIGPMQQKQVTTATTGQVPRGFSLEGSEID